MMAKAKKSSGHLIGDTHLRAAAPGAGQPLSEPQGVCARAEPTTEGQHAGDNHPFSALDGDDGGQKLPGTQPGCAPVVAEIRAWHRQREFARTERIRSDNALGAYLRRSLGWSRDLPDKESAAIKERAQSLLTIGEKIWAAQRAIERNRKPKPVVVDDPAFGQYQQVIMAAIKSRQPWDLVEADGTKQMTRLAKQLPVWDHFGAGVLGFGEASLAVIIAETGMVSCDKHAPGQDGNYPSPSHLWMRMCWGVIEGRRQGDPGPNASKQDWIDHGDSRKRRSLGWNIAGAIMKQQIRKVKDAEGKDTGEREIRGTLGQVYIDRKAYERARNEFGDYADQAAEQVAKAKKRGKKPRKDNLEGRLTPGHLHNRAQRYMFKRLLRKLWQAWREANVQVKPKQALPPAEESNSCGQTSDDTQRRDAAGGAGHGISETQTGRARAASSPD